MRDPAVRKLFIDGGAEPMASDSPDECGAFIRAEITKWAKVVTEAGIPPQ
jgi:tripartite-type tricarboxylate transporter receptor subunit TctC